MTDERTWALGLDIGGTKIAGGIVNGQGKLAGAGGESLVVKREYDGLSEGGERAQELLLEVGHVLLGEGAVPIEQVVAAGIGCAGTVDFASSTVLSDPSNIPGLQGTDFEQLCTEEFGLPIYADNDVNCAAYAEAVAGAGRGYDPVFCVTLGAGVGGGLIIGGDVYRGAFGSGMEIGHIVIDYRGKRCRCGAIGHLETVFSTADIERQLAEAVRQDPESLIAQRADDPHNPTARALFAAADDGDATALKIADGLTDALAAALGSMWSLVLPEVIVVGGGMAQAGDTLLDPLRRKLPEYADYRAEFGKLLIVRAALGPEATLIGTGLLALHEQEQAAAN